VAKPAFFTRDWLQPFYPASIAGQRFSPAHQDLAGFGIQLISRPGQNFFLAN